MTHGSFAFLAQVKICHPYAQSQTFCISLYKAPELLDTKTCNETTTYNVLEQCSVAMHTLVHADLQTQHI